MKRKINPKKIAVAGAAILIAGMTTAGIVAAPRYSAKAITRMNTKEMSIDLDAGEYIETAMPNAEFDYPAFVMNDGDYISYLRVRVNKSWHDAHGKFTEGDTSHIILLKGEKDNKKEIKSGMNGDWIIQEDSNGEDVYFYYRNPVEAKNRTSNFMDAYKIANISNDEQSTYAGKKIHINVETEGVQVPKLANNMVDTEKAVDAILSEWGLEVYDIDAASGRIGSIEEE